MDYAYDVFLSYRHKLLDSKITLKTFHLLEAYRMPGHIKRQGFNGVRRVFRDTEELAVSRILSNTIEEALRSTNCLVVVCSADTPSSEWVDREVATFIELGRAEKIFPLMISGDPDVSFPPSLKKVPDIMSRLMDVRSDGDDAGKIIAKAEQALLRVIAEVSGCAYTELLREHKLRKLGRTVASGVAAIALFAAVGLVSGTLWLMADAYKAAAQAEQTASMRMLEGLTYDLPNNLVELPGTYNRVLDILDKNTAQIADILKLSNDETAVALEMGANYEKLSTAQTVLGDGARAVESQAKAIAIYQALYETGAQEALLSLASAWNNAGIAYNASGDYNGASAAYDTAISLQETLLQTDSSYEARYNMGTFLNNTGSNKLAHGDYEQAIKFYEHSCAYLDQLIAEGYAQALPTLAQSYQNLGVCCYNTGAYDKAQPWLEKGVELSDALFNETPNRTTLTLKTQLQSTLATCLNLQAKFDEAIPYFNMAIESQEFLAADMHNITAQNSLSILYNNYGLCLNMKGLYDEAEDWYLKRVRIEEYINDTLNTPLSQAGLARTYYNVAENAFKAGNYSTTRDYYDRCLALYEPVSDLLGSYHQAEYLARLAYYQIIVTHDYAAALENAALAAQLQPDSSFVLCVLGYALMYNDLLEDCDIVFSELAARSQGEVVTVALDFEALKQSGMPHRHMESVLALMNSIY